MASGVTIYLRWMAWQQSSRTCTIDEKHDNEKTIRQRLLPRLDAAPTGTINVKNDLKWMVQFFWVEIND